MEPVDEVGPPVLWVHFGRENVLDDFLKQFLVLLALNLLYLLDVVHLFRVSCYTFDRFDTTEAHVVLDHEDLVLHGDILLDYLGGGHLQTRRVDVLADVGVHDSPWGALLISKFICTNKLN